MYYFVVPRPTLPNSVDFAGLQAKMASIEIWIPWRNALSPIKLFDDFWVLAYRFDFIMKGGTQGFPRHEVSDK